MAWCEREGMDYIFGLARQNGSAAVRTRRLKSRATLGPSKGDTCSKLTARRAVGLDLEGGAKMPA